MKLAEFLAERGAIQELAKKLSGKPKANAVLLSQWKSDDGRQIPAERCIEIEKATDKAVTCEEMRDDIDWSVLRKTSKRSARR